MADFLHLMNGIADAAVALFCFYVFFVWYRRQHIAGAGRLYALSGFIYLVLSLMEFSWLFGLIAASEAELTAIFAAQTLIKTLLVLLIFYKALRDRKFLIMVYFAILVLMIALLDLRQIAPKVAIISFSTLLFTSLYINKHTKYYLKKAGITGIFYSVTSIAFVAALAAGLPYQNVFWFATELMFLMLMYFMYLDLNMIKIPQEIDAEKSPRRKKFLGYAKHAKSYVMILFIIFFTIVTSYTLHEIGHALAGLYYGCGINGIVLYDEAGRAHTSLECFTSDVPSLITWSGLILTTLIGIIFMLLGIELTDYIGYILIGMGFMIGYADLKLLISSDTLNIIVWLSGMLILVYGIIKVTGYYLKDLHLGRYRV